VKTKVSALFIGSCLLVSSMSAMGADMMVRMRAISVMPVETGTVAGGDVTISNAAVPELDFSYFFNENFAAELILATATHKVGVYDLGGTGADLGSVSLLPPTLLAQYHKQFGKFKPYVGAGLNYTVFYGADAGAVKTISYTNSLGYAFQVGADYQIGDNLYLNFDIKKLYLSTDVEAKLYDNSVVKTQVNINPYIVGLGLGYKF
jgi:outer membrane protein